MTPLKPIAVSCHNPSDLHHGWSRSSTSITRLASRPISRSGIVVVVAICTIYRVRCHVHWLPGVAGTGVSSLGAGRPSGVQAAPSALMISPMTGNQISMKRYTFVSAPALIS
jgi:hypothetical protein